MIRRRQEKCQRKGLVEDGRGAEITVDLVLQLKAKMSDTKSTDLKMQLE